MNRILATIGLFSTLLVPTLSRAEIPIATDDVLAKVRAAIGYDALVRRPAIECLGGATRFGKDAKYRFVAEPSGRFYEEISGQLGDRGGFDGKTAWVNDWSRATRRVDLQDRELAVAPAWIRSGRWLASDGPFEITVNKKRTNGKEVVLDLKLKDGVFAARVNIDPATWLPQSAQATVSGERRTWTFSDYKTVDGVTLPRRTRLEASGTTDTFVIDSVNTPKSVDTSLFAYQPHAPSNATFDPKVNAKLELKRTRTGHLLCRPKLDDKDVGWFILDSGAGLTCIDKTVADKLGLENIGDIPATGMGGTVQTHLRHGKKFQLGRLTTIDNIYVDLDLRAFTKIMGETIAGIVGYPVFQAAIVEIEVNAPAAWLYDPAGYKLTNARWEPLLLNSNHPCCQASFEGDRNGVFRLDTGAAGTVSFHTPAVKQMNLLKNRKTSLTMEGGVGGMKMARTGKLKWFELGGHRFEKPKVVFSTADEGPLADEYTLGNLGQDFIKPFRLVFAYPSNQIAFIRLTKLTEK